MASQLAAPVTGATVIALDATTSLTINPPGGLAALTVALPRQPTHEQRLTLGFAQAVAALTLTVQSATSQGLVGTIGSATAGQTLSYQFHGPTNAWRLG